MSKRLTLNNEKRKNIENVFKSYWEKNNIFIQQLNEAKNKYNSMRTNKQININPKITDFIIKNVERSYEKMFKFLKDVDELSLSTGKSININLIKKVLNQ